MQIEHRGNIDRRRPHKGLYIATGRGGFKLLLKPGVNRVSAEDWAKVKDSPNVKSRLAKRHLVIHEDDSDPKAKRFDFASLDVSSQLELVERTIDPDVLQDWQRRSKGLDPVVAKALHEQIKVVTTDGRGNPAEPRKIDLAPIRPPEGFVNAPDKAHTP